MLFGKFDDELRIIISALEEEESMSYHHRATQCLRCALIMNKSKKYSYIHQR